MSNNLISTIFIISVFLVSECTSANPSRNADPQPIQISQKLRDIPKIQNPAKVIHVLVALCDNENQGIIPIPAFLGNGEDTMRNLCWGAAFGIKTYFSKSANWEKVAAIQNPKDNVLERIIFKHKIQNVYLIADAYCGSKMRETLNDFFTAVSGAKLENVKTDDLTLQILGSANLVAFVGHNGLMDFRLRELPAKKDNDIRDAVVLACASRNYFAEPLRKMSAKPLLWTSNLMAPEACILHDALEGWGKSESDEQIRTRAAAAYSKYQKISLKAA